MTTTDVRSKNLYELLGNDPEEDSDREPAPPVKVVDRTAPRHGKRDVPSEPRGSNAARAGRGGRGGRFSGNEQAFRDRTAGSQANRSKTVEENPRGVPTGVVKNRDARGNVIRDDRQSHSNRTVTGKQAGQGWGDKSGESNWKDEKIGEAIAQDEEKEAATPAGEEGEEKEPEPEDKSKSYAEYLAEQAENKREELGIKAARKPNEGAKGDKIFAGAKELRRGEEDENYFKGKEEKSKREKVRKEKAYVDVDMRFVEQPRGGRGDGPRGRGGRGGGRGRGGRGDAPRGAPRGGRGGFATPTVDEKNFPSLGGK